METMMTEMADIVKSMNEDMNEIKTSLTQAETKLETVIEAKLVDSAGKELFNCVMDLRGVVGITNEANGANKAVKKKVRDGGRETGN